MENTKGTNRWIVVLAITVGSFMCSFNTNAVNMALPLMQSDFHVPMSSLEWIVVAYLLTLSATLLSFGRLSDMIGHKKLYSGGFIGFTAISLLCALSPNFPVLVICVVLQGLCAALMLSSSNAIVIGAVDPANRGKALGMTGIAIALATCIGPALGGLMAERFGWRSIYAVNLLVGAIGSVLALTVIPRDSGRRVQAFDFPGGLLIVAALVSILLPLDLVAGSAISPFLVLGLLAAGAAFIAAFILREKRARQPLLDLGLFGNRIFAAGNLAATFFYLSNFDMVFMAPFYLQKMCGLSPTASGIMMLPMSAALMVAAPVGGALSDRFDSRFISSAGLALVAAGEILFGTFGHSTPQGLLIGGFAMMGLGIGLFQTPNNSAVMGSAPAERRGIAGATLATMRNIGMALGEASSAAILAIVMARKGVDLASAVPGEPTWQAAFGLAMRMACYAAAAAAVIALALSLVRGRIAPAAVVATDALAVGTEQGLGKIESV
jgi:EmrB/QacA subfamily drug resistance transporter